MRKTKEEAELTRQALMNAAEHLFIEKGLSRTTHTDIAERAGVTRGALNWHFPDGKNGILAGLLDRKRQMTERLATQLACCERKGTAPVAIMRDVIIQDLEALALDDRLQRILRLVSSHNEFIGEFAWVNEQLDIHSRECHHMLLDILKCGVECGEIRLRETLTSRQAASLLLSSIIGVVNEWLVGRCHFDLSHDGAVLIDTLLAGIVEWQKPSID